MTLIELLSKKLFNEFIEYLISALASLLEHPMWATIVNVGSFDWHEEKSNIRKIANNL
jgi:hypothetical protein